MNDRIRNIPALSVVVVGIALAFGAQSAAGADAAAAQALARQSNCFKCHAVDKAKDGPSYKEVAAKYKGKPDAQARLVTHITTGEKAKFPDGHEEDHPIVKSKDAEQIKNLIEWVLSQ